MFKKSSRASRYFLYGEYVCRILTRNPPKIWAAAVDPDLTPNGLISPGLGDTVSTRAHESANNVLRGLYIQGDRLYNTLKDIL